MERFYFIFCDDERCVVCVCVDGGVGDGMYDVVDVEEEEGGGEGAALWDAMRACLRL